MLKRDKRIAVILTNNYQHHSAPRPTDEQASERFHFLPQSHTSNGFIMFEESAVECCVIADEVKDEFCH
jgi:hypothetical protein